MKLNLSTTKNKLSRLLVCSLLIAFVFQTTAITWAQPSPETIPRSNEIPQLLDTAVAVSDGDPILISTQEEPVLIATEEEPNLIAPKEEPALIASEDREIIRPENTTLPRDEEIKTITSEDAVIGYETEDTRNENYQPLIGPQNQTVDTSSYLGASMLMAVIGVVGLVLVAKRSKKVVA